MIRHPRRGANLFCCYALMLLSIGCGRTGIPPSSPIVAVIDDDSISLQEFQTAFREAEVEGTIDENSDAIKELKRTLFNGLIERHLFLAEAGRLKLSIGPEELQQAVDRIQGDYAPGEFQTLLRNRQTSFEEWRERLRRELLSQKVIHQAVPENIEIGGEEIDAYYRLHRSEFTRPLEIRARQIVVADKEAAKSLRLQLLQGADFSSLAGTHSLSPDKDRGGELGFFAKGEMPEEFDIVFTLEVGAISPVVKTAYGYHLFKLEERRPARPMTPAEAAVKIRAHLAQERRERSFAAWVAELKRKARITVNYQMLYQPLDAPESASEPLHE